MNYLDPKILRFALDEVAGIRGQSLLKPREVKELALAYETAHMGWVTLQADIADIIPPLPDERANDPILNRVKRMKAENDSLREVSNMEVMEVMPLLVRIKELEAKLASSRYNMIMLRGEIVEWATNIDEHYRILQEKP